MLGITSIEPDKTVAVPGRSQTGVLTVAQTTAADWYKAQPELQRIRATAALALLLCVRLGAPDWTLFAAYAATATVPNIGGMSRARWAHLLREIHDLTTLHPAASA